MGRHMSVNRRMVRNRTVLVGAVTSSALLAGALGGASPAGADCVSVSGLTWGSGCKSAPFSMAVGLGPGARAETTAPLTFDVNNVGRAKAPARGSLSYEEFESKLEAIEEQDAAAWKSYEAAKDKADELAKSSTVEKNRFDQADALAAAEAAVRTSYKDWENARDALVKERDELKRAYPVYTARSLQYEDAPAPAVDLEEARANYQVAVGAANEAARDYRLIADAAKRQALAAYDEAKIVYDLTRPQTPGDDPTGTRMASDDVEAGRGAYEQALSTYGQFGTALDQANADVKAAREVWIKAELAAEKNARGGGRPLDPLRDIITALTSPQSVRHLPGPVKAILDAFNPSVGGGHRLLDPVEDFVHSFAPISHAETTDDEKTDDKATVDGQPEIKKRAADKLIERKKRTEDEATMDDTTEDDTTSSKTKTTLPDTHDSYGDGEASSQPTDSKSGSDD
jgi:hypothetical protein